MLELGTQAPDFSLPDFTGKLYSLKDFSEHRGLLVVFMCNHCPFVKHLKPHFPGSAGQYMDKGVAVVGINSNRAEDYPEDDIPHMKQDAERFGYPFPYLVDESQETALAYRAACTPDFFLFDAERKLFYRGQYDGSRPGNGEPVTGKDLDTAVDALLAGEDPPEKQMPSMGCSIKWAPGNEPDYFR